MILAWMVYSTTVALLLAVAAWTMEGVLRLRGWPVRWVWVYAVFASMLIPAVVILRPQERTTAVATTPTPVATVLANLPAVVKEIGPIPQPSGPVQGNQRDRSSWLLGLWASISLALAVSLSLSYTALARRKRTWRSAVLDGRDVWVTKDVGPAVIGFLPGQIVVPEWLLEASGAERTLVLQHEEEHVRSGDPRLLLGALILTVILPWNLAIWWMAQRLRRAVEIDCDSRVLAGGADPREYSRLLVKVAERGAAHHTAVVALSESSSFLERRIRYMLTTRASWWRVRATGAIGVALMLVATACWVEEPAAPTARRLTLWITSGGSYHIEDPATTPIALEQLSTRLRERLAATREPTVLNVRAHQAVSGYDYIMARRAACEAGVRLIDFAGELPPGALDASTAPQGMRGEERLNQPCISGSLQPDTLPRVAVRQCFDAVVGRPEVDSLIGGISIDPKGVDASNPFGDRARLFGVVAVRTRPGMPSRAEWTCDIFLQADRTWRAGEPRISPPK